MKICKSEKGDALIKTMLIPLLIVVLTVTSFYAILNGVIEIVEAIVGKLVDDIEGATSGGIQWLGLARVSTGLPTFVIYEEQVENLKNKLEAQSIDTEKCGITQVRLRKMLLAYAVSSSLSDTVCAAQITEEEMIKNYKEKEKIDEKTEVEINDVLNKYGYIESTTKWEVTTPYYILYYADETPQHTFFYFKDSSKKFGENADQWYIGAMGATTITTADDQTLNYVTDENFDKIKENFEGVGLGDKLDSEAYKQMQNCYTKTGVDTIKMYTLDITQKEYYFSFENKNIENNKLEKPEQTDGEEFKYDVDADSVYNVGTQEINLSDSVDLSQYSIPIELMIDFLNMTGSGEFLETFIDFALNEINTQISAYSLNAESVAYNVRKYNIDSNFVIEMYNMVNEVLGDDAQSFEAYYDIIYNRKYNNSDLPENKVTKIDNYEDIGKTYRADGTFIASALEKYLKTAYDPGTDFSLGDIIVTEVESTRSEKNDWRLMVTTIETWYGTSTYTIPTAEEIYTIPDKTENVTEEEYNNYNHTKITNSDFTDAEGQEKEIRYLYKGLLNQVKGETIDTSKCNLQGSDDIYDDAMKTDSGADNRAHFQNWVMNGLAEIAQNDNGDKNSTMGAGQGTDYIYCKYEEINVKKSVAKEKTMQQIVDENNIVQQDTTSGTEEKIEKFLALLRNKDGEIPDPLNSGVFTEKNDNPSIVVRYGDIYNGTIPVGDLLLDNGARMLFELLDTSENTKQLVPLFKYMAYRYSGVDYGVTDISQLASLFSFPGKFTGTSGSGFWWPIGSATTRTVEGKLFADGTPVNVGYDPTFGRRFHPVYHEWRTHTGLDLHGSMGDPIIAVQDGKVVVSQKTDNGGYGIYVDIDHGNGIKTRYGHMRENIVNVGDVVKQGQVIGYVGNTGTSTGPHLHFEVRVNDEAVDPGKYINSSNPRPQMAAGGLSQEAYAMLLHFEGGTQYMTSSGDYKIFNNGIDKNFEITCGIAVGYQNPYQSYYPSLIPNPSVGQIVSKDVYNKIFEKVCKQKYNYVDTACAKHGVTLTNNQRDAVFMFIYNMGGDQQAIANKAIEAFKTGGAESYYNYTKECSINAVYSRRAKEYELFKNGTYIK